jgi:hypothetical protein
MGKRKRIEPAPPVATDPRLREFEAAKRREIALLKELDMAAGQKESLSVSTIASELDADAIRGAKVRTSAGKAHGTPEELAVVHARIARTYAELKLNHPEWKREKQFDDETSARCRVSIRTVQRYKGGKPIP